MSSPNEDELVREAVGGNRAALKKLFERHGPTVEQQFKYRIPARWQSVLAIDDLMQETYTEAFLNITAFVPRSGTFEGWLATIARHNLLDALDMLDADKRGGAQHRVEPDGDSSVLSFYEKLRSTTTTPSRALARGEAKAALNRAIEELPEDYRRVVRLYDIEGQSTEQVAAQLNRRPGAMFMLRARAHRLLAEQLGAPSKYLSESG